MAANLPPFPGTTGRRDWRTAFDAIRKLLANPDALVALVQDQLRERHAQLVGCLLRSARGVVEHAWRMRMAQPLQLGSHSFGTFGEGVHDRRCKTEKQGPRRGKPHPDRPAGPPECRAARLQCDTAIDCP